MATSVPGTQRSQHQVPAKLSKLVSKFADSPKYGAQQPVQPVSQRMPVRIWKACEVDLGTPPRPRELWVPISNYTVVGGLELCILLSPISPGVALSKAHHANATVPELRSQSPFPVGP